MRVGSMIESKETHPGRNVVTREKCFYRENDIDAIVIEMLLKMLKTKI